MAKMAQGPSPATAEIRQLAEAERVRLDHPYLGDEHVLLGVLAHGANIGAVPLVERGIDLAAARAGIARIVEGAGPITRDDAAVLREFGVDVARTRRRLETTFGTPAVLEAERQVRLRPRWRGRGGHSPLCGPPYLIKRAQHVACASAGDPAWLAPHRGHRAAVALARAAPSLNSVPAVRLPAPRRQP